MELEGVGGNPCHSLSHLPVVVKLVAVDLPSPAPHNKEGRVSIPPPPPRLQRDEVKLGAHSLNSTHTHIDAPCLITNKTGVKMKRLFK